MPEAAARAAGVCALSTAYKWRAAGLTDRSSRPRRLAADEPGMCERDHRAAPPAPVRQAHRKARRRVAGDPPLCQQYTALAKGGPSSPIQRRLLSPPFAPPSDQVQTFRYAAPFEFDVVRQRLGGHEIPTAIDQEAGLIRLTTMLAPSSGVWLSSERPACGISETAAPRTMGAALTYARCLATLQTSIAGEDDLDAPGLGGFGGLDV